MRSGAVAHHDAVEFIGMERCGEIDLDGMVGPATAQGNEFLLIVPIKTIEGLKNL